MCTIQNREKYNFTLKRRIIGKAKTQKKPERKGQKKKGQKGKEEWNERKGNRKKTMGWKGRKKG